MKTMIKLSFVMAAYAVVACVGLAVVYRITAPRIEAAAGAEVNERLRVIFPDADGFSEVTADVHSGSKIVAFNQAFVASKGDETLGMVIKATGPTYKTSTILVGVNMKRELLPIVFLENNDTPGLGTKTAESDFAGQFSSKSLDDAFAVGDDVEAISGATISSKGVADILKFAGYAAGAYLAEHHGAPAGSGDAPVAVELAPMENDVALAELFPGATCTVVEGIANTLEGSVVFDKTWIVEKDGAVSGVAIQARGQTYKASTVIVGVNRDRTLAGLRIVATGDTKNYGRNMLDPAFYGAFTGKSVDDRFMVKPADPDGDVDSISGATISTMGVANMVKVAGLEGAAFLAASYGGKKPPAAIDGIELNLIPDQE